MDGWSLIHALLPIVAPLIIGYVLDLLIGDPHQFPHPVRIFGICVNWFDKKFNKGEFLVLKGAFTSLTLVISTWWALHLTLQLAIEIPIIYYVVASLMVFYGLANRELIKAATEVEAHLSANDTILAREKLSLIVGRDTMNLEPHQIRAATLETLSENLSDGVVAPLFFYAIGGLPLMFAYKMVNTMDSMVGYKNDRYIYFGKFAARLDDLANFIPARLTAVLMIVAVAKPRIIGFILRNGHKHASPNSGWPEAAIAGILDCKLGGPSIYEGKRIEKPFIGDNNRVITGRDIYKACNINNRVALIMIALVVATALVTTI